MHYLQTQIKFLWEAEAELQMVMGVLLQPVEMAEV
jgi:hypothetical protein